MVVVKWLKNSKDFHHEEIQLTLLCSLSLMYSLLLNLHVLLKTLEYFFLNFILSFIQYFHSITNPLPFWHVILLLILKATGWYPFQVILLLPQLL